MEKFATANYSRTTIAEICTTAANAIGAGGSLFKSVQSQYPTMDESLLKDVVATIGGKRDEFTRSQQNIMELSKEHSNLLRQFPGSIIFALTGNTKNLAYTVISSDETKTAVMTGIDNRTLIPR